MSGGGYIGSWLTAWLHRKALDRTPDPVARVIEELSGHNLPPGRDGEVRAEAPAITQLRRFSNYLAPKSGLLSADLWALIATVLRNIILTGGGSRIRGLDAELQRLLAAEGYEQPAVCLAGERYREFVVLGALKAARQARENQWQQVMK